jgi:hypothetical protein
MRPDPNSHHAVRRVVLPSGKTIEIVYFAEPGSTDATQLSPRADRLHLCPRCESPLAYPTAWEEIGGQAWQLTLRCPNCEWIGEGEFSQEDIERLDEELDDGTHILARDLKQLMHANMAEEIERFVTALHADHILPMDF